METTFLYSSCSCWNKRSFRIVGHLFYSSFLFKAICFYCCVVIYFIYSLLPESPRWLHAQGKSEEAVKVLAQLHSRDNSTESPLVQIEMEEIKKSSTDGQSKFYTSIPSHKSLNISLYFSQRVSGTLDLSLSQRLIDIVLGSLE